MTLLLKTRTKSAVKHSIKNLFRLISLIFLQPFVRDCKKKLIINFFGVLSAVTSWSSLKWHLKIAAGKGLTISIIDLLYLMAQNWSVFNSTRITVVINYFSSVTKSFDMAVVDFVLSLLKMRSYLHWQKTIVIVANTTNYNRPILSFTTVSVRLL